MSGRHPIRPKEPHETLTEARAEQATKTWKTGYALRAGIEGTINQALDVTGLRRARYRGLPKARLQRAFPPPPSTSSASTPTGTPANRPSRLGPADSPASATNSQPQRRIKQQSPPRDQRRVSTITGEARVEADPLEWTP
ncbi:transposase [Streptomyces minutiscleroticus]|uniref:transposase n=1 Tax=Streptomyces minutiscleroticus TaxID=68238 RepID=UPI00167EFE11